MPVIQSFEEEQPVTWGETENQSFEEIKQILGKPVLQLFNPINETKLHTDACSKGLAAMLLQRMDDDGKMHPVYAISRRTNEIEQNYHSSKLELLAIVWAVRRLEMLLINIKFTIVTDCQALIYLNSNKTKNPQIVRWYNSLCEFNFEIVHRSGEKLTHVDALSGASTEEPTEHNRIEERMSVFTIITTTDEILLYQTSDEHLQRKIQLLKKTGSEKTPQEKGEVKGYELKEGLLYYRRAEKGNPQKDLPITTWQINSRTSWKIGWPNVSVEIPALKKRTGGTRRSSKKRVYRVYVGGVYCM